MADYQKALELILEKNQLDSVILFKAKVNHYIKNCTSTFSTFMFQLHTDISCLLNNTNINIYTF